MNPVTNVSLRPLYVAAVAIVIVWFGLGAFVMSGPHSLAEKGQFGDAFGTLNALFSGLAFAGIIYTVLLQRKELELQRQEMELTRNELRGQKDQLARQNELTVLSAQLSALPLLLEQEALALETIGGQFKDWTSRSYSNEELRETVDRSEKEASQHAGQIEQLSTRIEELGASFHPQARVNLKRIDELRTSIEQWKRGAPRLQRIIGLRQDLENLYRELRPNKAPEPTPVSVTPRATEGASK